MKLPKIRKCQYKDYKFQVSRDGDMVKDEILLNTYKALEIQ